MARIYSGKRPKNLRRTFGSFVRYLGRHRLMLVLVAMIRFPPNHIISTTQLYMTSWKAGRFSTAF